MNRVTLLSGVGSLALVLAASPVYADDITECEDNVAGDDCVQEDGEEGVCIADEDTQILACSDNGLTEDEMACEGLADGDDCTLSDGDPGVCDPGDNGLACSTIDNDEVSCETLAEGDECTQEDGEIGVCETDDDTGELECSDNGLSQNQEICQDLAQGDACTHDSGRDGSCDADEDTGVLECVEPGDTADDGCSASSNPAKSGGTAIALVIGALALARRKRSALTRAV